MNSVTRTVTPLPGSAKEVPGWILLLMMGGLIAFAPLSIDMYLPGLPEIARELGSSAGMAQATLAAYLVGMALGQLLYGPLADRYGRKPPLYFGLALYTVASLGCVIAPNMGALIAWRFVQAMGGCATVVVPLAMVSDRFDQLASARVLSRLMLVMGVAPILAPVLGSFVVAHWGWRAIFAMLALGGFAALIGVWALLPETLVPKRRQAVGLGHALSGYSHLLQQRNFMGFALIGGFSGAAMFSYIAGSSFVFIDVHGLSAQQYGAVFGANALGMIIASQVNHALLGRWRAQDLLRVAVMAMALLGLLGVAGSVLSPHVGWVPGHGAQALLVLLVPVFGFLVMFGLTSPNTSAAAMAAHRSGGGSASALMGTLQFGQGALAGALVGALSDGSAFGMTAVMAACGVGALLSWRFVLTPEARR